MSARPDEALGSAEIPPKRVEIIVSGLTVFKAAIIALGVYLAIVASEVLLTIGLAFVFALGLDPLVGGSPVAASAAARRRCWSSACSS